eukprot:TRINITY_DN3089_c0_g1_i12.p1 TRINITY_DN3089_c0_g1~~TRINITY_DN3089_c0_g1_i12.p1  ORF type:complete len:232 (+),score=15.39 TRINITY_DN3089_c0_g1_i12:212-907(+)
MNIYVTTASNAEESSWGTYCPGYSPSPPPDYDTCLGDLYSVGWMEDSEAHNTVKETLQDQYIVVKERTSNHHTYSMGSHVMQYGDTKLSAEALSVFMGFDPANANATFQDAFPKSFKSKHIEAVDQRDADLLYLWQRYRKSRPSTSDKVEAQEELAKAISYRTSLDRSIELLGKLLFGAEAGPSILKNVRARGEPLVDDWGCLKRMVMIHLVLWQMSIRSKIQNVSYESYQ